MNLGNVNSHIQMPRFLLARFENEHHSFFYYDVPKRFMFNLKVQPQMMLNSQFQITS